MSNGPHFLPVQRFPALYRARVVQQALVGDPALILLTGGPGTGKSVSAAQIAEQFAATRGPSIWMRFDDDEVSHELMWQRIFNTIHAAGVVSSESTSHQLVEGGLFAVTEHLLVRAFSELPTPLLIVVDVPRDSVATSSFDQFAANLINVLEATAGLTFVLTLRHAPQVLTSTATRLRIPVRELDAATLALSHQELEEFVRVRLPDFDAETIPDFVASIHKKSEGWPLAAHALVVDHEANLVSKATRYQGSFVREYVDQLLDASSPEIAVALCASALLSEVSAPALAIMLNVTNADAVLLLEGILDISFTYWEDDAGTRWFRHHDLIQVELESRSHRVIGAVQLQEMYGRVAVFLSHERQEIAIPAARKAQDWSLLSELLLNRMNVEFSRDERRTWLSNIPLSVREEYPVIAAFVLFDEYAFPAGKFGQVMTGLKMLAGPTLSSTIHRPGLTGIVAAGLRMVAARLSGNEALALTMADSVQEKLESFDFDELTTYRGPIGMAITQVAITLIHAGQFEDADQVLELILMRQDQVLPRTLAHAFALSAWSSSWQGEMGRARAVIRAGRELSLPMGWHDSYIGAGYRIASALDALDQGQPDSAKQHLEALAEHESTIEHWPFLAVIDSLITESRYGPAESLERFNRSLAQRRGKFPTLAATKRMLQSHRARLQWQTGQVLPKWKRGASPEVSGVFASLSRGENETAVSLTGVLLSGGQNVQSPRRRSELLLLRAESLRRREDDTGASESANLASALLLEYGLSLPMRVLSRDAAEQLAKLAPQLPLPESLSESVREIRPLTPAQRRALIAVVQTGSVPAAAQRLFLSPETVKAHMKEVYRKLGVTNRQEAVKIAIESGMLESPTQAELSEQ